LHAVKKNNNSYNSSGYSINTIADNAKTSNALQMIDLSMTNKLNFMLHIANALQQIHHVGMLHRDIKSANVLLFPTNYSQRSFFAKICDFGLAKSQEDAMSSSHAHAKGTLAYMAPETFDQKYGKDSDVYAFTVLLNETLSEQKPFMADNNSKNALTLVAIFQKVVNKKERPESFCNQNDHTASMVDEPLRLLIARGWHQQVENRLDMVDMCSVIEQLLRVEMQTNMVGSVNIDMRALKTLSKQLAMSEENNSECMKVFNFERWAKDFLISKNLSNNHIEMIWNVLYEHEAITDIETFVNVYTKSDFNAAWFEKKKIESKALQKHFLSLHDEASLQFKK
jgi:serine/threonine protein kinase